MSNNQYDLLNTEVTKIASGQGVTEGAMHDLRAKTVMSNAAAFVQKFGGKPTGAQLGAFIQQNKEYLKGMNEVNKSYLNDFQANEIEGFQPQMTDKQYKSALKKFGLQDRLAEGYQPGQDVRESMKGSSSGAGGSNPNEEKRTTKDGKIAVFDSTTKKFLRFE
jgi:hypothetical protein